MFTPIGLIALEAFEYHGRTVVPWEYFEAQPDEATSLRYSHKAIVAGKAERLSKQTYQTRDMVAR